MVMRRVEQKLMVNNSESTETQVNVRCRAVDTAFIRKLKGVVWSGR